MSSNSLVALCAFVFDVMQHECTKTTLLAWLVLEGLRQTVGSALTVHDVQKGQCLTPTLPLPIQRNTQTSAFQSAISCILQWKSPQENIHIKLFGLGVKWLYLTLVIMRMSCVNIDRQALNFCDAKWQQCILPISCSSLRARESRSSCTMFLKIRGSQRTDRRVLHFHGCFVGKEMILHGHVQNFRSTPHIVLRKLDRLFHLWRNVGHLVLSDCFSVVEISLIDLPLIGCGGRGNGLGP